MADFAMLLGLFSACENDNFIRENAKKSSFFERHWTVSEYQYHTPSGEERCFLYFNHLFKEFMEQMIPHSIALI